MSTSYYARYGKYIELKLLNFSDVKEVKVCSEKNCKLFDEISEGKYCGNCGNKLSKKNIDFLPNVFSYLRDLASSKGSKINPDNILNEYYGNNIIFAEGHLKYISDKFTTVPFDVIKESIKEENDVYNFIVKALKDKNIEFKEVEGFFLGVN